MAISNVGSNSRPGVCTSTTRPQAPFEGQLIYETDTNRVLVWDNAAWVMIADTDQPPGLQLIKTGTLSGADTDFVGCFPSDYNNFRVLVDSISFSSSGALYWQLLDNTTPVTSNYRYAHLGLNSVGTSIGGFSNGASAAFTGTSQSAGVDNLILESFTMDIMCPNVAQRTFAHHHAIAYESGNAYRVGTGMNNNQTAYDGLRFLTTTAVTLTGNVSIYGYRK